MPVYVIYDTDAEWVERLEADSLDDAIEKVLANDDYMWQSGNEFCVAEERVCANIKLNFVPLVEEEKEDLLFNHMSSLPTGTFLRAKVDAPVCIDSIKVGDIVKVISPEMCVILTSQMGKCIGGKRSWGSSVSSEVFNSRWEIVKCPSDFLKDGMRLRAKTAGIMGMPIKEGAIVEIHSDTKYATIISGAYASWQYDIFWGYRRKLPLDEFFRSWEIVSETETVGETTK